MQVCINSVQGNDYPYFYCMLVAKPELGLLERPLASPPRKVTVERNRQGEVDVVVIRQATTKTQAITLRTKPPPTFSFMRWNSPGRWPTSLSCTRIRT